MSKRETIVVITGKTLDNKDFTITASNMSSLATTYKNTVKKDKLLLPDIINVVYYGDFVILCPNYTFAKGKVVPGNGGFTQVTSGGIIPQIVVVSTEFPISIINYNYVVILSKTKYTPKIIDTDKIYLSKVSPVIESPDITLYNLMYTKHGSDEKDELIIANHDIITISDIYDNPAYTIANICNNLAALDNTYSFDIHSGTSFTFYFGITTKTNYIPILFTNDKKYKNIFTKDYLDLYFNYYSTNFNWWYSTFCQTIDFNTTADNVTIRRKVFFADGSNRDEQSIFTPSTTPYIFALYCPADDIWLQTDVGKTLSLSCPSGYIGQQTRTCLDNGIWSDIDSSLCVRIENKTQGDQSDQGDKQDKQNKYLMWIILSIVVVVLLIIIVVFVIKSSKQSKQSKKQLN